MSIGASKFVEIVKSNKEICPGRRCLSRPKTSSLGARPSDGYRSGYGSSWVKRRKLRRICYSCSCKTPSCSKPPNELGNGARRWRLWW
ncbi:hypothetical protein E2562_012624 [Oryza meyeriana var. granulata]|uniref:Uncharacterized protein n=1 Tax=Oryza meyeriana var. granulata TaxID=110450 RepID=A0A6G1CFU7_9ORYZ|nr:hypothetical protein E2562_012624 [Oryza meyeriana var. granulata]